MSNNKVWIPPGMRPCTWDEAQWMSEDGEGRLGIGLHGLHSYLPQAKGVTWLCIDTKPQHTHEDRPWVRHGFEECSAEEASKSTSGFPLAWRVGEGMRFVESTCSDTFLRPSPLVGLKRALEIIAIGPVRIDGEAWLDRIHAELAKYEPPVCSSCGQPVVRKGEP